MWRKKHTEEEGSSSSGGRRRVVAFVPLTVLLLAAALAMTGGIDGWPNLGTVRSPGLAKESITTTPTSAATGGTPRIIVSVGESGTAISSCVGCASPVQALQHLGHRTTADGIAIRIFTQSVSPPSATSPSGTQATEPTECFPTKLVHAEISDAQAVTVASGALYGTARTTVVVGSGTWGEPEGSPADWVIVSVPPSVALVVASFGNGTNDSMAPIDGIGVMAAPLTSESAASSDGQPQGAVAAFNSNGSQVGSVAIGGGASIPSACSPPLPTPPVMPNLGPQPADIGSARKAVRKAFETLYSPQPDKVKFLYLQDADAQVGRAGKAAAGTTPQVAAKSLPVVRKVVFTTKTHAAVLYEIDYNGNPVVGPKIGYAVLVGKVWKVTRATYCGDIDGAHTGVNC